MTTEQKRQTPWEIKRLAASIIDQAAFSTPVVKIKGGLESLQNRDNLSYIQYNGIFGMFKAIYELRPQVVFSNPFPSQNPLFPDVTFSNGQDVLQGYSFKHFNMPGLPERDYQEYPELFFQAIHARDISIARGIARINEYDGSLHYWFYPSGDSGNEFEEMLTVETEKSWYKMASTQIQSGNLINFNDIHFGHTQYRVMDMHNVSKNSHILVITDSNTSCPKEKFLGYLNDSGRYKTTII